MNKDDDDEYPDTSHLYRFTYSGLLTDHLTVVVRADNETEACRSGKEHFLGDDLGYWATWNQRFKIAVAEQLFREPALMADGDDVRVLSVGA